MKWVVVGRDEQVICGHSGLIPRWRFILPAVALFSGLGMGTRAAASPDFFSTTSDGQTSASRQAAAEAPYDDPRSPDSADSEDSDDSDATQPPDNGSDAPLRTGGTFFAAPGNWNSAGQMRAKPSFGDFGTHAETSDKKNSSATANAASSSGSQASGSSKQDKAHSGAVRGAAASAAAADIKADAKGGPAAAKPQPVQHFEIDQYAVEGADALAEINVEAAVYPFMGPGRTAKDVEAARAALEKAYHDRGYQTVSVAIPPQNPQGGVIVLKVTELKVGRLRIKNAHYFDIDKIKQRAASLREGKLPDFNAVTQDIVALNQWPDRRITPTLRAGVTPGTVDVDLNVDDKDPLHGSLEINDRQSPGTLAARVTGTAHYDNLWQIGHSLTFTYQVAPSRPSDAQAFSGSYLARIPTIEWLSVLLYGVYSKSDVAAIGGLNVVGPGQIAGIRAVMTLPSRGGFYQTLSLGPDYKHFDQTVGLGGSSNDTPVTYLPITASYSASYQETDALTQLDLGLTAGLRGVGSDPNEFDNKRFDARGDFFALKGDLSRTQNLPQDFQIYGKVQGQVADQALVSSEEFSLGGFDTVRGYLGVGRARRRRCRRHARVT